MDMILVITSHTWVFTAQSTRAQRWFVGNLFYGKRLSVDTHRAPNVARAIMADRLCITPAGQNEAHHLERIAATLGHAVAVTARVL